MPQRALSINIAEIYVKKYYSEQTLPQNYIYFREIASFIETQLQISVMETFSGAIKWLLICNENKKNQLTSGTTKDQGHLCYHSKLFSKDSKEMQKRLNQNQLFLSQRCDSDYVRFKLRKL